MTSTAEPTSPLAIETTLRGVVRLLGLSAVLPRMGEYRRLATTTTDASRIPWTSSEGRRLTPRKRHLSATSSPVACQAHPLKVAGSNPAPATNSFRLSGNGLGLRGAATDTKTDTEFGAP